MQACVLPIKTSMLFISNIDFNETILIFFFFETFKIKRRKKNLQKMLYCKSLTLFMRQIEVCINLNGFQCHGPQLKKDSKQVDNGRQKINKCLVPLFLDLSECHVTSWTREMQYKYSKNAPYSPQGGNTAKM